MRSVERSLCWSPSCWPEARRGRSRRMRLYLHCRWRLGREGQRAGCERIWRCPRDAAHVGRGGVGYGWEAQPAPGATPTFLKNHGSEIMAVEFFTVPTFGSKVLFVFVVLAHRRREVLHFKRGGAPYSGVDRPTTR